MRCLISAMLLLSATPAFAQNSASPSADAGNRRFRLADFSQFSPVNALDMVRRIPGFSIEKTNDRRGFGDNGGNVLIDGDKPSTKSDTVETILQRIPANEVDYIELNQTAGSDSETRGQGQTVNVVRKKGNHVSGTYDVGIAFAEHGNPSPFGSASISLRKGATVIDLNGGAANDYSRAEGPELFEDGQRRLVQRRDYLGSGRHIQLTAGGAIKSTIGSTKINANAKVDWLDGRDFRGGIISNATGQRTGTEGLVAHAPDHDFSYELGGDLEFPLAEKLSTKFIALWRSGRENVFSSIDTNIVNKPVTYYAASNVDRSTEAIVRMKNDWSGIGHHAIQFGAELAFNRLRSSLNQISTSDGVSTLIPASNVEVSEWRIEPFLSDAWTISPTLKLEAGLVFEHSRLSLAGDNKAKRSLSFLKPRAIATWTVSKTTSLEFRAEKEVAQLNFGDFATRVDVGSGNQVDVGNSELVPQQKTSISATIRHKFLERGSIALKTEQEWIKDTQDLIPVTVRDTAGNITGRFDGAGNIGNSTRFNLELEITLPFDWATSALGIRGMEVKYVGHYHNSRVIDPVTLGFRRASNRPLWHQQWDFRHDLGDSGLVWGASVYAHAPFNQYFIDQFRQSRDHPKFTFFAEYKKFKLGTIRLELADATRSTNSRDRYYFQGTRASGALISAVERERIFDRSLNLSLSGKF